MEYGVEQLNSYRLIYDVPPPDHLWSCLQARLRCIPKRGIHALLYEIGNNSCFNLSSSKYHKYD